MNSNKFLELIKKNNIDFLDFGCSKGGSLEFAKKYLGGLKGLGIDIDDAKIKETKLHGHDAINYDIKNIPNKKMVRFCILSHFLEHVPNLSDVSSFVNKACSISKDFVYIQQPYFDADSYLFKKGLKLYWSDWRGHPNRMTSLDIHLLLRDLAEKNEMEWSIHARKKIRNSNDTSVHSIKSDRNQHQYDAEVHPPKDFKIDFEDYIFYEIITVISFPGYNHDSILNNIRYDHTIFYSNEQAHNKKQTIVERFKRKLKNLILFLKKEIFKV